ncbi:MAG: hypothetical protein JXB50_02255 [Spirochaetes bacterium]|nr:hypothetical protein [Spirochaetota bacterium]
MDVIQVFVRLKHNNIILERNYNYQIIKYLFGFNEFATFRIQKDYYKANEIKIKKDDKILFQISTDGNNYIDIFDGVVAVPVKENETGFIIDADNNTVLKEKFQETFEDVKMSEVLSKLAGYELLINDMTFKRIVLKGTKKQCLLNVIKTASTYLQKTVYCYYSAGKIVITDNLSGKIFNVDEYTVRKEGLYITIFPIPELTIKDQLSYNNTIYNLESLVFEDNKILCEVLPA